MNYTVNKDLRQRHLVRFLLELKRRQPPEWETRDELPLAIYYDVFIKSAIAAEWITGITEEQADDLTFEEATSITDDLLEVQREASQIEKN